MVEVGEKLGEEPFGEDTAVGEEAAVAAVAVATSQDTEAGTRAQTAAEAVGEAVALEHSVGAGTGPTGALREAGGSRIVDIASYRIVSYRITSNPVQSLLPSFFDRSFLLSSHRLVHHFV